MSSEIVNQIVKAWRQFSKVRILLLERQGYERAKRNAHNANFERLSTYPSGFYSSVWPRNNLKHPL